MSSDDMLPGESAEPEASPLIAEMERTAALLAGASIPIERQPIKFPLKAAPHTPQLIFVEDAFTNAKHLRFALRGGLSAIVCYFFYMSVGWNGLNASIATCVLTALPQTGAARHKQLMRFSGVVLGACAIGFVAQVLILPQIDSIAGYALLFASVIAIGAWIATSTPRIAYCGAQVVLAFEIVNVSKFSINPSLIAARDAVLGIVLGIVAMWLIFDHLWASSTLDAVRPLMMNTLREIANLSVSPGVAPDLQFHMEHKTEQILQSLNRIWALTEFSQFESFPRTKDEQRLVRHIKAGLPTVRAVLLARTGLLHHCLIQSDCHPTGVASKSQQYCTHKLLVIVSKLDDYRAPNPHEVKSELGMSFSKTPNVIDESNEHSTEVVLSRSLMFLTDQLQALFV